MRTPGAHRTLPSYGRLPTSALNSTVLPLPLGPITASELPAGTANDNPRNTTADPNRIARSETSSTLAIAPTMDRVLGIAPGWRATRSPVVRWRVGLRPRGFRDHVERCVAAGNRDRDPGQLSIRFLRRRKLCYSAQRTAFSIN